MHATLVDLPRRAATTLVAVLAVLGVVQACAWPLAMATTVGTVAGLNLGLAWAAWAAAVVATATLFATAGGWASRLRVPAVGVIAVSLLVGGLATPAGLGTSFAHPTLPLGIGAAVWVALLADSWAGAALAWGVLVVCYMVGIWATLAAGLPIVTSLAENLLTLVLAGVAVRLLASYLADQHRRTLAAVTSLADLQGHLAATDEREKERERQYRMVHDTVLSSLSALARGTLDPTEPQVRGRLTADAEYLRGLIVSAGSSAGMFLVGEISAITREFAPSMLRVHPHVADVPDHLPPEVLRALSAGVREALTNVTKHAGTREAWVTIVGDSPGVVVTVTDRGRGFDPAAPSRGLGLSSSIGKRIVEVGGHMSVDSAPGQGTTIELRWTP